MTTMNQHSSPPGNHRTTTRLSARPAGRCLQFAARALLVLGFTGSGTLPAPSAEADTARADNTRKKDDTDWRRTRLTDDNPTQKVLHLDLDGDGQPDILERWWNGRRVRWLDENGDLRGDDTRGDTCGDVMQVDRDGNGRYDDPADLNLKWADGNGDGLPDTMAIAEVKPPHWMIFRDFDNQARLGYIDWQHFTLDCWGKDPIGAWRQNYHGNSLFLKAHRAPGDIENPRMNWENPFAFYDLDDDGMPEAAARWFEATMNPVGKLSACMIAYNLANSHDEGTETAYSMSLGGFGGPGVPYETMSQPLPGFKGLVKFDPCFRVNNWRRVDAALYMPYDKCLPAFFTTPWTRVSMVFDEDGDDHRWERVEFYCPDAEARLLGDHPGPTMADPWSVGRKGTKQPGLCAAVQSDTLGDRGEFDLDNSGKAKLYVGSFDRKIHLLGAEWGAWTVDMERSHHGGVNHTQPPFGTAAEHVTEVVRYKDTDGNGFIDLIEYDYDGDRTMDHTVNLLDYRLPENQHPDVAEAIDPAKLGWKGLHELFVQLTKESWRDAMLVYQAAWRKGLTTPETETLSTAASRKEQHRNAYWLKEKTIRLTLAHLSEVAHAHDDQAEQCKAIGHEIMRCHALGDTKGLLGAFAKVPGK